MFGVLYTMCPPPPPVQMIGLYQDPTGEKDIALHGLQGVKSVDWNTTSGAGSVVTLEAARDSLKMEIEKVLTQCCMGRGSGVLQQ